MYPEEGGHDFCGMQVKISHTIGNVSFLLTQQHGWVCTQLSMGEVM